MTQPDIKLHENNISIGVWIKEHNGKPEHSIRVQRSYQDKENLTKFTEYFKKEDIKPLQELLTKLYDQI